MMVVTESREMVLQYSEAFKSLSASRGRAADQVTVYGAFSGKLQHGEDSVDEAAYNAPLQDILGPKDTHKHCSILIICDRFETGYDNSAVSLLGVDRKTLASKQFAFLTF